eukprot:GSMAST32.ASY1.ANO1.253.1 assembled CDS
MHQYAILRVEYVGTAYGGWQRQSKEQEAKRSSVQGQIERAVTAVSKTGEAVVVQASGRTDRGVHALDQVVVLRLPPLFRIFEAVNKNTDETNKINENLPNDIVALSCSVGSQFRMRFRAKRYKYYILQRPYSSSKPISAYPDLISSFQFAWYIPFSLNLSEMSSALRKLEGSHDFKNISSKTCRMDTTREIFSTRVSICNAKMFTFGTKRCIVRKNNVTEIEKLEIIENNQSKIEKLEIIENNQSKIGKSETIKNNQSKIEKSEIIENNQSKIVVIEITANGFLKHQVRRIIAWLIKMQKLKLHASCIVDILDGSMKNSTPPSAPSRGLWLDKVYIEN